MKMLHNHLPPIWSQPGAFSFVRGVDFCGPSIKVDEAVLAMMHRLQQSGGVAILHEVEERGHTRLDATGGGPVLIGSQLCSENIISGVECEDTYILT